MMRSALCCLALVISLLLHGAAQASVLTPMELIQGFNAIIFENATTTADIEGAALIGGNFSGATSYITPQGVVIPSGFGALNVLGNTYGNPINLNNGGNAYVGGTKGAIINFNGGGHYLNTAPPMAMSDIKSELTGFSAYLKTLTANSSLPVPDNNEKIIATPDASGLAVFNITVAQLSLIPSYQILLNAATTVIFNVSGNTLDFHANSQSNPDIFDNVIWNFYEATSLTFDTLIGGSVLAPLASVTNNNQIDGTLVAKTWTGQGELHEYQFDGDIPHATPEPVSLLLSGCGLGCLALLRRFKASKA